MAKRPQFLSVKLLFLFLCSFLPGPEIFDRQNIVFATDYSDIQTSRPKRRAVHCFRIPIHLTVNIPIPPFNVILFCFVSHAATMQRAFFCLDHT